MKLTLIIIVLATLSSCVSKKKYEALQNENAGLKSKVVALDKQNTEFNDKLTELSNENKALKNKK